MQEQSHEKRLRALPAVHALLERPEQQRLMARSGRGAVVRAVRRLLDEARERIRAGGEAEVSDEAIARAVEEGQQSSLRRVINATGVLVHTNLGRAPLAEEALREAFEIARGYSSLEYDLERGARGSRHAHLEPMLKELCGAEAAVVANNNAGAVLLVLSALATGREVVISRGELVEIGGGFRVPDLMAQSGARLVAVGTSNRTRLDDYERALGDKTALLLRVHRSNFALVGFTKEPSLLELAGFARARGIPLAYDAGSGCLLPLDADPGKMPVRAALEAGADLVTFSGDKLLGGPQAGIVVGRASLVEAVRRHPLMRALRPDKLCLAALFATLRLWRDHPEAIPLVRMLREARAAVKQRADAMAARMQAEARGVEVRVVPSCARIGGGASPLVELESAALRIEGTDPDALAEALRSGAPPVVGRIEDGALLLDVRCVLPGEEEELVVALVRALGALEQGEG